MVCLPERYLITSHGGLLDREAPWASELCLDQIQLCDAVEEVDNANLDGMFAFCDEAWFDSPARREHRVKTKPNPNFSRASRCLPFEMNE